MMFVDMRSLIAVLAAYLLTLAAERFFDLGVLVALLLGIIGLFARMLLVVVAMPLIGLSHADPQWLRTTIVLYAAYALIVLVTLLVRRKSTPPA